MKLKTIALTGVMSLAGLGLIGAGAHAVFTTSTTSSQSITAGNLSVVLYANGATGNGSPTIALPSVGPVGSTFASNPIQVQVYNNGSVTATEITLQMSDSNNNTTLQGEVYACMVSGIGTSGGPWILFNEPLWKIESYGALPLAGAGVPVPNGADLAPGVSDYYILQFYAGPTAATQCGATVDWYATAPAYPNGANNPAAASLTSPAQGGTVIPALTLTYSG
jgi:predicted ribosomally synthesized peptide with SipW-like signal peptide